MNEKLGKTSAVITIAFAFIAIFNFGWNWAAYALIAVFILFIIYEFTGERSGCSTFFFLILIVLVGLVAGELSKKPELPSATKTSNEESKVTNKNAGYSYIYEIEPLLPEEAELEFFKVSITDQERKEECKMQNADSKVIISCKHNHPLIYSISGGCNVVLENIKARLGEYSNPNLLCQ